MADAPAIAAIYAPCVRDTAISFELDPPDAGEMARRIAHAQSRWAWLVAEDIAGPPRVLSYAYAGPHAERAAYRWAVSTSVYGGADARRRGIGRALYTALLGLLQRQGFHSAFAGITQPNGASVGLHEAMGFSLIGTYPEAGFKLGRWHDVSRYGRRLQPAAEAPAHAGPLPMPADTLTLAEVLAQPGGAAALAAGQALLRDGARSGGQNPCP